MSNHPSSSSSQASIIAGLEYFSIVFTIAFALGAMRITLLVPQVGELVAVLMELPIILVVSWKTTKIIVQRRHLSNGVETRAIMGLVAFELLMVAELALSVMVFGKTAHEFATELVSSPPQIIGFCGQIVFGFFPMMENIISQHSQQQQRLKST